VSEDLQRLRAFNFQDKRQWYQALEAGYNLVKDQKQSDWAKEERTRRFPAKWETPARDRWFAEHPVPDDNATADRKREHFTEVLRLSGEWAKEQPYNTMIWGPRVGGGTPSRHAGIRSGSCHRRGSPGCEDQRRAA